MQILRRKRFSPRYALVELLTSVVYLLLFWKVWVVGGIFGICLSYVSTYSRILIDLDHMIIPNKLVVAALVGGVLPFVYNIFRPWIFMWIANGGILCWVRL